MPALPGNTPEFPPTALFIPPTLFIPSILSGQSFTVFFSNTSLVTLQPSGVPIIPGETNRPVFGPVLFVLDARLPENTTQRLCVDHPGKLFIRLKCYLFYFTFLGFPSQA